MGVEIRESSVSDAEFAEMKSFVRDYLRASVENEDEGGRMRWYPWHSADYRFNHILNVVDLATEIADGEGADRDVVRVAALFHDVAKLDADQEDHAEVGAEIAREYLDSRGEYDDAFVDRIARAIATHSTQEDLDGGVSLETRCVVEADALDKIGVNGVVLILVRMGYEARSHMDAAEMVDRVVDRGASAADRVESDTATALARRRLKRVRWFREWLADEVAGIGEPDH